MRVCNSRWAVIFLLLAGQCACAQSIDGNRLTVYGKVTSFAKTDRATISFDIKGVGKSLRAAFADADSHIDSIAIELYALGLDESNLSTTMFQSGENYGDKAFLSSKRNYRTIMTASVSTDSLQLLEEITIILSEGDIERINLISFDLIDYAKPRQDALATAVAKAKEKAALISEQLDVRLGHIIEVEELRLLEKGGDQLLRVSGGRSPGPFYAPLFQLSQESIDDRGRSSGLFAQEIGFGTEVRLVYELLKSEK